jgi:hypothetical protein
VDKSLEALTKWLRQSGPKENEAKTEVCLFNKNDHQPVQIEKQAPVITNKKTTNVLGVISGSKLCWSPQVNHTIKKSTKLLTQLSC